MLIIDFSNMVEAEATIVGNKAYNLALLANKSTKVNFPKSAVIPTSAKLDDVETMNVLAEEICKVLLFPLIMRSSTTVEDSSVSFAGLFESTICYNESEIIECIRFVKASVETEQVKAYAKIKGVDFNDIKSAVLIQEYKNAESSGVLFTKHPVTNDESVVFIEYKEKTSDAVTNGSQTPSSFIVSKSDYKDQAFPFAELCELAVKEEREYGCPIDMEYVVSDGKLWVVQIRQITT